MFRDKGFLAQVVLLAALTFGGGLWILDGAPIPVLATKPLEPSPEVPTFQESVDQHLQHQFSGTKQAPEKAQPKRLGRYAQAVATGMRRYEQGECDGKRRRAVFDAIVQYDSFHREFPTLLPPNQTELLDGIVRKSITPLFAGSMLTLREFPRLTREWLETFVQPGSKKEASRLERCQVWG